VARVVHESGAQLALLRATAVQHLALPLVFGNGGFRGFFVIESIKVKSQQLSAGGAPIAIRVALALKEWVADLQLLSSARRLGALPLGIATVPGGVGGSTSDGSTDGSTPGVSSLLSTPSATGATGPELDASDVPTAVIVRSAPR